MTGTKNKTRQREHMINHENNLKAMNRSRRHEHNQTKPNLKPKPNQSCIYTEPHTSILQLSSYIETKKQIIRRSPFPLILEENHAWIRTKSLLIFRFVIMAYLQSYGFSDIELWSITFGNHKWYQSLMFRK